jgi:hypothetical protein
MKAKTFKDWLIESAYTGGDLPKRITLITSFPDSYADLSKDAFEDAFKKLETELKRWDVTANLFWHEFGKSDTLYCWFGWDSLQEWGSAVNLDEERLSPTALKEIWKKGELTVHSARNDWDAVKALLSLTNGLQTDDLVWLNQWCELNGHRDLSIKIKELPNWPGDLTDWALGDW